MARKGIFFPLKDAALRDDVHALGSLVGEVLIDQCGQELFDVVEGDRQVAISRRQGDPEASVAMVVRMRDRSPEQARELIRAFTAWFHVVNLAEKVHRVRRRRQYLNDSSTAQPGGLHDCFGKLRQAGVSLPELQELLRRLWIEPVFTAHPTESTRRTLLRQQERIAQLLISQLDPTQTPGERRATIERIRTELTTGWQTAGNSRERLTVADEREHALYFLAEVIYEVIPSFYEEIERALVAVYGAEAEGLIVPEVLHFGSWVGGDMDGHPDVHAKTIRESCARHSQLIVNRYFLEVRALAEKLSQSASRIEISPAIQQRIEQYKSLVPAARASTPSSHDHMPYRVLLGQIAERLRATYDHRSGQYERVEQFLQDLELIADSLRQHKGRQAGLFHVRRLQRRVRTFGFYLASLDVRQRAEEHRQIVGAALAEEDWSERRAAERTVRLRDALSRDESPINALDAAGKRALWVFEAMAYCSHRYGAPAIGAYVISMAEDVDDLLSVLLLAQWAGLTEGADRAEVHVALDVAPLFETVEVLENAGDIMRRTLSDAVYRGHVATRGDRQVIMLGYSESNKAVGIMASRWLLRKAQESMASVCNEAGVELLVFHGRSGTIARGGSRASALIESMPAAALHGHLRATEQGESINERFGLRPIALRSFEQSLSALALATAGDRGPEFEDTRWREAIELISRVSMQRYRSMVHEDPEFVDFFHAVTPADVIERMQIGSRPVVRGNGSGIDALRAIPWMFAWSQARYMLPGWLGCGAGLRAVTETFGDSVLGEMYSHWPFFSSLIDGIETTLARSDMEIASFYDQLAPPAHKRFSVAIREEFQLTREHVLAIKGCARLLDSDPTLQRSIRLRNPYVDPIHLTQVNLLRRWRETDREDKELFEALLASVNGISQGLQGSG
jgi:phosphoenolpyruvate carboxylase